MAVSRKSVAGEVSVQRCRYVLVTPARNEEKYIESTIRSVTAQTILPERWVIVSDGSTDRTDEIVSGYRGQYPWIDLVRMPEHRDRQFAAKVQSFNAGFNLVKQSAWDIIGALDADISFEPGYFAFLLGKFSMNPRLGVAGTPFVEGGKHYDFRFTNIEHVSGACQVFRRECFEEIGGYVPIRGGGIDWLAVTAARMRGWQTRTFTEMTCLHHRPMGTGSSGMLRGIFRQGQQDYSLGGHPLWQVFRGAYQTSRKPYLVGGLWLLAGYLWAFMTRAERPVPREIIQFHRGEQMARLRSFLGMGNVTSKAEES